MRGSGNWIGRDGTESTKEYGRTYEYDLRSDLSVEDFQTGIDFGKRDLLSQGDILVFGVLGGWLHGDVDFDGVNRQFSMSGAQAGAYATYLEGGLFVDTLFKADILKHEQQTVESRARSTRHLSECVPTRAIASEASGAARSSSRWPRSG